MCLETLLEIKNQHWLKISTPSLISMTPIKIILVQSCLNEIAPLIISHNLPSQLKKSHNKKVYKKVFLTKRVLTEILKNKNHAKVAVFKAFLSYQRQCSKPMLKVMITLLH